MFRFQSSKTKQLQKFAAYPQRFRFFFPLNDSWHEGIPAGDAFTVGGKPVDTIALSSYVITYRNGQLVHESKSFNSYPEAVIDMEIAAPIGVRFSEDELTAGNHLFSIRFEQAELIKSRHYYRTTIANHSGERAKIVRFGGFIKDGSDSYRLNTITNDFFTESDFCNWYLDSPDNWIADRQEVYDPVNYGGPANGWAFEAELESGRRLWFSALVSG